MTDQGVNVLQISGTCEGRSVVGCLIPREWVQLFFGSFFTLCLLLWGGQPHDQLRAMDGVLWCPVNCMEHNGA